jgi:hypothetical protein
LLRVLPELPEGTAQKKFENLTQDNPVFSLVEFLFHIDKADFLQQVFVWPRENLGSAQGNPLLYVN